MLRSFLSSLWKRRWSRFRVETPERVRVRTDVLVLIGSRSVTTSLTLRADGDLFLIIFNCCSLSSFLLFLLFLLSKTLKSRRCSELFVNWSSEVFFRFEAKLFASYD
ncbi:hypothetical protein F2P81_009784 [Scophthalmus maximus]|uniref:Uncharacterized protein n=1 Tax=Scophthalmus maximus TaxID=52904 RepID=A0A6A4SYJ4_SCOMX|nr:hypothetical protein F2P81_009784 [Scophthalmus maximus]